MLFVNTYQLLPLKRSIWHRNLYLHLTLQELVWPILYKTLFFATWHILHNITIKWRKYSLSLVWLSNFLTCDVITDGDRFGPNMVKVFATLNLTLATRSVPIVKMVGSINRSVISAPQASAKTYIAKEILLFV